MMYFATAFANSYSWLILFVLRINHEFVCLIKILLLVSVNLNLIWLNFLLLFYLIYVMCYFSLFCSVFSTL